MGGGRHRNTTGSLASRVERPAFGTLDPFVDVNGLSRILGRSISRKLAKSVRFQIARQLRFPHARPADRLFSSRAPGKHRTVAPKRERSMSIPLRVSARGRRSPPRRNGSTASCSRSARYLDDIDSEPQGLIRATHATISRVGIVPEVPFRALPARSEPGIRGAPSPRTSVSNATSKRPCADGSDVGVSTSCLTITSTAQSP
jgi:hypothetical protein